MARPTLARAAPPAEDRLAGAADRRAPDRPRRRHRRGARLARRGLLARHHRVRPAAQDHAPPGGLAAAPGRGHRRPAAGRHLARAGGQGARRRPQHRRHSRGAKLAQRGAPGDRPQAGHPARGLHLEPRGGLQEPPGVRPVPRPPHRSADGADRAAHARARARRLVHARRHGEGGARAGPYPRARLAWRSDRPPDRARQRGRRAIARIAGCTRAAARRGTRR